MNYLLGLYRRYRTWEDGYIDLLNDLNEGRPARESWMRSAMRRRFALRCAQISASERAQMRDFIWRHRGWRGWMWLAGIVAVNTLVGLLLHLGRPQKLGLVEAAVMVNLAVLLLGLGLLSAWFNPKRMTKMRPRVLLRVLILAVVGALGGAVVMALLQGDAPLETLRKSGQVVVVVGTLIGVGYAAALAIIVGWRNSELTAANAQLTALAEQERLGNQLAASRLRLLQAQIEPHFLFNTLGAVQQLAEHRAPEAAALTAHLVRFLRNSMAGFRSDAATLGGELAVIESYLQIMQSRLGDRLRFRIDVPDTLRERHVLPTLLLTLVENAIKHGIEPAATGGNIAVHASEIDTRLVLEVADTGLGMADLPGHGTGLQNIRDQLVLAHGDAASLELFDNEPHGLVARLILPLELRT